MRRILLSLPFLLLLLAPVANADRDDDSDSATNGAGSAGAGKLTVAQQCEKARIKADIELASCMGKAKLKGIKGPRTKEEARLARCDSKLAERLRRAEARAERKGGSCPTPEPVAETTEAPSWLMVQDSGSVSFDFDDSIDEGCPAEAFWSGTMTMGDADPETLWFSDRPDRVAFTQCQV